MIFERNRRPWQGPQSASMRIGALIVARMDSQRFPGKVLHKLGGRTLLDWVVERLKKVSELQGRIAIATTSREIDDPINKCGQQMMVPVFRSQHVDNVALRLSNACEFFQWDGFLRVNGDSPLVDSELLSKALNQWKEENSDFITNIHTRTYPYGISCEGMKIEYLKANIEHFDEYQNEHVTSWFYDHLDEMTFSRVEANDSYNSDVRMTVDTEDDLIRLESALEDTKVDPCDVSFDSLYKKINQTTENEALPTK